MKKIALILIFSIITSCSKVNDNGLNFNIKNTSDDAISNITISTSEFLEKKNFEVLEKDLNHSDFLSMKDNKFDGNYILTFTRANGENDSINFGYYSNGICLNKRIEIEIKIDTVLTKFGESKRY